MRPGVHASVLRTSTQTSRRVHDKNSLEFSMRKLIVIVILGLTLLLPGVGLSFVGFKRSEDLHAITASSQSMYKVIGPIGCVTGTMFLFAAGVYYWCYGTAEARRAHAHRHKALMDQKSRSHTFITSGSNKTPSPHHQQHPHQQQHHPHLSHHQRHYQPQPPQQQHHTRPHLYTRHRQHPHHSHGHDKYTQDGVHSGGDSHLQPMLPLTEENLQHFNSHQQNLATHKQNQHHHVIIVTDDHGVPENVSDQKFDFSEKVEAPIAPEETIDVSMTTDDGVETAEILNC